MPTHYEGNDEEVRALSAYINLLRAAESVSARIQPNLLDDYGVNMAEFAVLEALRFGGPMNQTELGEKLLRSCGRISTVINGLRERGLVDQDRDPEDRRRCIISLRPTGRELIERIFPVRAAEIREEMSILTVEEQETLRRLCRQLGRQERDHSPDSQIERTDNE